MHAENGVGCDFAYCRTEDEIGACGVALRAAGREVSGKLAAGSLQLQADLGRLRFETAIPDDRSRHPRCGGQFAQHVADKDALFEIAAGRREIQRQVPVFQMLLDECLGAAGGIAVDLALHRDPAVATAAAGVRRALGNVEHHRWRRCGGRRRPGRRCGDCRRGDQEQRGDGEGADWHGGGR
jgi:hypothetical protein